MIKIKNNKGITLMSLVISIIVLIILTSIIMFNINDDNDINIVDEAKNTTGDEARIKVKEEVLFAVMQSMDIYKIIDLNKLNTLLKTDITGLPANITIEGYSFRINSDGTIEEIE